LAVLRDGSLILVMALPPECIQQILSHIRQIWFLEHRQQFAPTIVELKKPRLSPLIRDYLAGASYIHDTATFEELCRLEEQMRREIAALDAYKS